MPRTLGDWWPAAVLCTALLLCFGPTLAAGGLLAPGDGLGYYFPIRAMAAAAWLGGEWPLWNPYNFGGMPLFGMIQAGVIFPGNWPFLVMPPTQAMNTTVLQAYAVAGLATYAFARSLALGRAAGLLAALSFMLSGYMVAHLEHVTMLQTAGLLPAMLWAVERLRSTGRAVYAQAAALFLALQWLAGYPQTVVMSLGVVAAYGLWRLPERARWTYMGHLAAMAVLGTGLALVQLLPLGEALGGSARSVLSYEALTSHALPPRQLATFLMPFLFGGIPSPLFPTPYWGSGPWLNELAGYMGLAPLALALVGLMAWRRRETRFWSVLALVALALALGPATPLYRVWAELPVLKMMRVPGRHLLELDFAVAMLAAYGLTVLLGAGVPERRRAAYGAAGALLAAVGGLVAAIALFGPAAAARLQPLMTPDIDLSAALSPLATSVWLPGLLALAVAGALVGVAHRPGRPAVAALLLLTALDLGLFATHQGWRQLAPVPPLGLAVPPPGSALPGRALAVSSSGYPHRDFALVAALQYPTYGALLGRRSAGGTEAFILRDYAALMGLMQPGGQVVDKRFWEPGHHGLDLLAVRELRVERTLLAEPAWSRRLQPPRWQPDGQDGPAAIFLNRRAGPEVWRPGRVAVRSPEAIAQAVTADPHFDPAALGLLNEAPPAGPAAYTPGRATLRRIGFNRLAIETDGAGPGLVVISEAYDAGWRAEGVARDWPVLRVDGLLLGVVVPAGAQAVTLRYAPLSLGAGLTGSALSGLLFLAWLGWTRRAAARSRLSQAPP